MSNVDCKIRKQRVKTLKVGIYPLFLTVSSLFVVVYTILLSGCAIVSQRKISSESLYSDYVNIKNFCQKHNSKYNFDTIDDIITIYSPDKQINILLNSYAGISDGMSFHLKKAPVYFKGEILIPRQLEDILSSKKFNTFKPLFTLNTIVLDPGHGGRDPGAISPSGLQEKTINLKVSKLLKKQLESRGFKVILTRSDDTALSLEARVNIAKKVNADLFLSIHANANHSRKVRGVEVYYLSPSRLNSRERSTKLAKTEDFQGEDVSFDAKRILWDLTITKNHSFSIEVSNVLYRNFKNLGFRVKPPKKAPFYVLRRAYVPSVLIEVGYLSNEYEEKVLSKEYYQKQIAEGISMAVSSLKNRHPDFVKKLK